MRRRKRRSFHPVAKQIRRIQREAEKEMSLILSDFLGYQVTVKPKRIAAENKHPGDTTSLKAMKRRADLAIQLWQPELSDKLDT